MSEHKEEAKGELNQEIEEIVSQIETLPLTLAPRPPPLSQWNITTDQPTMTIVHTT